jgi:hypothetical protein
MKRAFNKPCSRMDWHRFYVKVFNRTKRDTAAQLAMWYLFLHLGLADAKT